jgi:RimJ/RimL family protein N-acetyltransferase
MPEITDVAWPRRTERLTLRPVASEDLDALWQIRRQETVSTWMTHSSTRWSDFLARAEAPPWMRVTLVVLLGERIIGDLMLSVEDAWAQGEVVDDAAGVEAEIGWCLDPDLQGQGYATEAVVELIRIAFEDLGLRRVTALCFAGNEPSWRLMERIGMRREAHFRRDSLHRSGAWLDTFAYALLADERVDPRRPVR